MNGWRVTLRVWGPGSPRVRETSLALPDRALAAAWRGAAALVAAAAFTAAPFAMGALAAQDRDSVVDGNGSRSAEAHVAQP